LSVVAIGRLVTEGAADSEQALQTGEDRARVIRVQKLKGEVHKSRPTSGEVILEDSLEDGDELLADEAFGSSENRQKAVSYASLFIFGNWVRGGLGRVPLIVVP
jgi:hypothetical protein